MQGESNCNPQSSVKFLNFSKYSDKLQYNETDKPDPPFVTFLHYSSARKHCSGEHQDGEMSI